MGLMLHAGAREVSFEALRNVATPQGTTTHKPIAHSAVVDMVRYALGFYKHEIHDERHAVMPDGSNYFGLLTLDSPYGDYGDVVGLRNSHDKSFPIGIAFGSTVFVCDNTAFIGEHVISRKHTAKAQRDLPGLVGEIVQPLVDVRKEQFARFDSYKLTPLADEMADHAIMEMFRRKIIGVKAIAHVLRQWTRPEHDWGGKTAWRLFNATTFVLGGKALEHPQLTSDMHAILDDICLLQPSGGLKTLVR
jgi:hypothetical protein